MLENEDIKPILLTRTPALTGRYEFLSFRNAAGGRAWLSAIREKAQSAAEVMASVEKDKRWVTVALTWSGLRALGVDEASLATFPEEFKQGMVARAEMLGHGAERLVDVRLDLRPQVLIEGGGERRDHLALEPQHGLSSLEVDPSARRILATAER